MSRSSDFLYKLTGDGRMFFEHCDFVHKVAEDVIARRRQSLVRKSFLFTVKSISTGKCGRANVWGMLSFMQASLKRLKFL